MDNMMNNNMVNYVVDDASEVAVYDRSVSKNSILPIVILATVGVLASIVIFFGGIITTIKILSKDVKDNSETEKIVYKVDADKQETKEQVVTVEYVNKLISAQSNMVTAKEDFVGILTIEEGKIPVLTKKSFAITYTGYVKASVELSMAYVKIEDNTIFVHINEPKISDKYIDPDSIVFYNEKRAVFNWTKKTDVTEVISLAEDDIVRQAYEDGILDQAKAQTEIILFHSLEEIAENYSIVIKWNGYK